MASRLVFVPAPNADSSALWSTEVTAWSDSAGVREVFDLPIGASHDEDAEHAAMLLASVAALAEIGRRRVLAFEVAADQVSDAGETVTVCRLRPTQLVSWFDDEDATDVTAAAAAARGLDVDAAWAEPAVTALLEGHSLLWHAAEEWAWSDTDPEAAGPAPRSEN